MITLRNINKRRELQQRVYDNYGSLTEDQRRELDHEVGAAFTGYELAIRDIAQIIADNKQTPVTMMDSIKNFIMEQLNGKATKNIFRFSELPTTGMQGYINSTVKEELVRKGHNEDEAAQICRSFIEYPTLRESIIERNNLDSIRICEHCGAPMNEGYLVNDMWTFCSEECARAALLSPEGGWTEETFNEHLAHADEEDSVIYWTQWEG